MAYDTHTFTWRGIEIELLYAANKDDVVAHHEVRSISPARAPLPITKTGFLSHYHPIGTVEANEGSLVEQVTRWLDEKLTHGHGKPMSSNPAKATCSLRCSGWPSMSLFGLC